MLTNIKKSITSSGKFYRFGGPLNRNTVRAFIIPFHGEFRMWSNQHLTKYWDKTFFKYYCSKSVRPHKTHQIPCISNLAAVVTNTCVHRLKMRRSIVIKFLYSHIVLIEQEIFRGPEQRRGIVIATARVRFPTQACGNVVVAHSWSAWYSGFHPYMTTKTTKTPQRF